MAITFPEYESFDALGLAQLVKRGVISPKELLTAAIERIEQKNPELNAVIYKMYEEAKQTLQQNIPEGPFQGVPFLLKDLLADYAGVPLTMGSRFTEHWIPKQHSEIVKRFIQSGLNIVGKTNTPEFGLSPVTESTLWGPARNPNDIRYSTGGSSGGSAAAVASGMVPMAHGGDGAGSLRIPAAYCGVFALKPTRGRTPQGPLLQRAWQGMVVQHVLTRSVRDSAAMLDILAPPELGAVFSLPKPKDSFLASLNQPLRKLKIAMIEHPFFPAEVHPTYLSQLHRAAKLCGELGHEVDLTTFTFDSEQVALAFIIVLSCELSVEMDYLSKAMNRRPKAREVEMITHTLWQAGKRFGGQDFAWALSVLDQTALKLAAFLEKYDVILTPTVAGPPPLIGQFKPNKIELGILELLRWVPNRALLKRFMRAASERQFGFFPFTPLFNMSGHPAISLPLYKDSNGLPIGIQFGGRMADEVTLLQLAHQIEKAFPWDKKLKIETDSILKMETV